MEDTIQVNPGSEASEVEVEQVDSFPMSQYDTNIPGAIECEVVLPHHHNNTYKQGRVRKPAPVEGLTGRQYQVLRILNTHGWCTSEMVRQIAEFHGILWKRGDGRVYQILRNLESLGYVVCRKVMGRTRLKAYAASERGMRYILTNGDALLCDSNAIKDPASPDHFLGLNKIMIEFRSQFQTKFWLSDFEVRSDNSFIGSEGLAKDYDSVAELILPTGGHVRFGIEFEYSQQSASRHAKLNSILLTEKRLQCVLFFLSDPRLRNQLMSHLKSLVGFAYFVEYDQFVQNGIEAPVYYRSEGKLYQAPLSTILKHASLKPMQDYVPVHQLHLALHW